MTNIKYLLLIAASAFVFAACRSEKYVASVTELRLERVAPPSGYSGAIIKILGRNFSNEFGKNEVRIGGKEAKVLEYNSWDLTVLVPDNNPGKYDIEVTTPKGTVTGIQFEYVALPEHEYVVSNFAGSVKGTEDGTLGTAKFDVPEGIILGADGSLFVIQRGIATFAVRKIDPLGNVSTLSSGSMFSHPWQGCFDERTGSLLVANKGNAKVVRVSLSGEVSDFPINGATLDNPMGMKFDADGNMYLANRNMNQVLKINGGNVSEVYEGTTRVSCLCVDGSGRVIIGSESSGYLTMLRKDDTPLIIAGSGKLSGTGNPDGEPGNPMTACIGLVGGIYSAKDGAIYFADRTQLSVRMLKPDAGGDYTKGTVTTIAKGFYPSDLVVSEDCRKIYVTSATRHVIKLIEVF